MVLHCFVLFGQYLQFLKFFLSGYKRLNIRQELVRREFGFPLFENFPNMSLKMLIFMHFSCPVTKDVVLFLILQERRIGPLKVSPQSNENAIFSLIFHVFMYSVIEPHFAHIFHE